MTPVGYKKVFDDLRRHKEVLRPQVVKDIEEARAHGDISENAEFEDAKERQGHIEGRIRELETTLSMAEVVDIAKVAVEYGGGGHRNAAGFRVSLAGWLEEFVI